MYHSIGIFREYIQVCITYSEVSENIFKYVSIVRDLPKSLFYL